MKTDTLIDMLARGAGPAPRALAARRLAPAAGAGLLASAALALSLLGPIPLEFYALPAPWIKFAYATTLALAAGWLTARLARPVARLGAPSRSTLAVIVAMGALALIAWWTTPEQNRVGGLLGHSWSTCPWNVLALSLPALAVTLWAVRGLAPTRPRAAGFAAGLLAGAVGAFGYAFACDEAAITFVAAWYTLGILLTGLLGAALGGRLLRW
jgi:hypothetical protein